MKMNETVASLTITAKTEGVDQAKKQVDGLTQSTEKLGVVSETTSKRVLSLEDSWKRQTLRLDETARAQANIARETKLADAALREGVATQAQHAQRLEQINQRYTTVTTATKEFGNQTGLARHELINLGRQAQDVGVSLVSGQSPLMILAQQGSQIADVFISSGKSVGDFFKQAMSWAAAFAKTPAGIVTGIVAIGAAAAYAAYQFTRSSTTVEQALENQNRLLKEGKALIDARTSAAERATLQARDQTEYETLRNLIDLQKKLKEAQKDVGLGAGALGVLSQPGLSEMGAAFSGVGQQLAPGMDKVAAAIERLNAAQAAGLPGLKAFLGELGKIGMDYPDLAKTIDKLLDFGRASIELENATMRAKAMSDALKGIATDAQLAAVGLGSIAQFKLSNLQADQARDATERQAKAVLELAKAYPGISIEVAKQLNELQGQLQVAQARTPLEQMIAQAIVTQNNLLLQGKTLEEAMAIAAAQRAVVQAQINTQAQQRLKDLQNEMQLIKAVDDIARDRIQSEQTLNKLLDDGVEFFLAQKIAVQELANATERRAQADYDAARSAMEAEQSAQQTAEATKTMARFTQQAADDWDRIIEANREYARIHAFTPSFATPQYTRPDGTLSQFNPAGYTSQTTAAQVMTYAATQQFGPGGFDPQTGVPNAQGQQFQFNKSLARAGGDFGGSVNEMLDQGIMGSSGNFFALGGGGTTVNMDRVGLLNRAIELLPKDQQAVAYQRELQQLQQAPASLETGELIKQLGAKLEELTRATDENTSATSAMTDVLSPFYSSDPRSTHLGFRAFAGGGIMTEYGALPLRQYQGGGMATSPQVAVFGEGSTPEAYVPVPSGRIPVEIKQPANSNQRPVSVTINVMGNADQGTVAALKSTAFQQAQAMRRVMR